MEVRSSYMTNSPSATLKQFGIYQTYLQPREPTMPQLIFKSAAGPDTLDSWERRAIFSGFETCKSRRAATSTTGITMAIQRLSPNPTDYAAETQFATGKNASEPSVS